ncbi:phage minor head protein [Glaesserella parasuis]|uniref:phage minor head protein n=1 Tax=Glaesserella parasuis TaxID=738 RepID=UPI00132CB6F0|nr:phage minor head protein [Glaesserella parasuis]MCT8608895.1 phage head morphogenesis protein [Glaesserella parasuis]MDE4002129.1 phage head morphogenesis protein [Glaesserella parasuis]MDE4022149.1 phage head morphogenesis protein [Glaesserella parasuis]MDG6480950.1 phage minor head protein [Glaesserella parasuis]MWQ04291.1 phage head morphogenesis protein [Glaesserella parasuis]
MKIKTKIKPLRIPTNKADPLNMGGSVAKLFRHIDSIYSQIKRSVNLQILQKISNRLQTNNLEYYPPYLTSGELAELLEILQKIIDKEMLANGPQGENLWFDVYIDEATLKGTQSAVTDLSLQSEIYRAKRNLSSIIFSPAYFNRLALAHTASYSEWQGLSDELRKTLAGVITEAVFNGSNVKETAREIKQKLDVSAKRAKRMAQSSQLAAYRRAEWQEAEEAKQELGLNTKLLHFSALKATTRLTHAQRHGKYFDVAEVRAWYSKDGNQFNCYCKQSVVVVNADGKTDIEPLLLELAKERKQWVGALKNVKK